LGKTPSEIKGSFISLIVMMNYHIPLIPEKTYHIFSRAMGNEKLFLEEGDYIFFLQQYLKYITPIADTLAYNLLPNHFHFIIRIKKLNEIRKLFKTLKKKKRKFRKKIIPEFIMEQFSNLLNSYVKTINNKYSRKGGLFIDIMKRKELELHQIKPTLFYIHKNSIEHKYSTDIAKWPWSSYYLFISNNNDQWTSHLIPYLFSDAMEFIRYHRNLKNLDDAVSIE